MSQYAYTRVGLDPLGIIDLGDGRRMQEIELVLTDNPDREPTEPGRSGLCAERHPGQAARMAALAPRR
jgi:hypothetical protein